MKEDWIECKFADVLNIKNGKNQKLVENPEGIYPIYGSSGIIGWADEYLCEEETTIIGRKGTINTPIFVNTKFWNVDTAFGLTPYKILNSRLLFYFCKLFNFHALDKSTTIPSLAKSDLLQIDFTLPPLSEQRAIVKKLESLFSSLDAGVADLKKAQKQLKIYRQAVLKKAFEAELTKEWREKNNVNNSWSTFSFKDIADVISGKNQKEVEVADGKYPIYGSGGIIGRASKFICEEGTTIVGRKGTINSPIYVKEKFWNIDTAFGLKSKSDVDDKLFYFWCLSYNFNQLDKSTTIPSLAKRDIELIQINLTKNQLEQHQIVKQIESRLSVCDSIEQNIKESLEKAEALRQSILKKAFEGNLLTAQELAECKLAKDYEPAGVLLEKMKMSKK